MNRSRIYDYFFLTLLIGVLYSVVLMLSPFADSLLASLACALLFFPIFTGLQQRFPKRSATLLALVTNALVLVLVVTPFLLLIWAVIRESSNLGPVMKQWSLTLDEWRRGDVVYSLSCMRHLRGYLGRMLGMKSSQFQAHVAARVSLFLEAISLWGAHAAEHAVSFALDLLVMQFTLFFLFRDGRRFCRYLIDLVPLRYSSKERLMTRFQDTVVGVSRGWILTSVVQGVFSSLGYLAAGIEGALLLGVLTGAVGLLPIVGTFGIWVPLGVFMLAKGSYGKAAFVLLWGAIVVVGLIDTIIRPYLVGKRAELPIFPLFFALLGGVEVWGAKGILLGPILVAVAPVLLEMYRDQYLRVSETIPAELPSRENLEVVSQ